MSGKLAIARPYAKAAFEFAVSQKNVTKWALFLQETAFIINHPKIKSLFLDPKLTEKRMLEIMLSILGDQVETQQKNFLHLLIKNHRIEILSEVYDLFLQYQKDYEKTVDVELITAFPISKKLQDNFSEALEIRLQREVTLNIKIESSLLGGAIIRAGDFVIDGSIRGQLQRLKMELEE